MYAKFRKRNCKRTAVTNTQEQSKRLPSDESACDRLLVTQLTYNVHVELPLPPRVLSTGLDIIASVFATGNKKNYENLVAPSEFTSRWRNPGLSGLSTYYTDFGMTKQNPRLTDLVSTDRMQFKWLFVNHHQGFPGYVDRRSSRPGCRAA